MTEPSQAPTAPTDAHLPTLAEDFARVLVVVAHPDDIEYGAAAAVARWRAADIEVSYLLATYGEAGIDTMDPAEAAPVRAQEERDGAAEVGVEVVHFLDHRDGVVEYGLELRRDIAWVIRRERPDLVVSLTHRERFAGGGTNQADHIAVGRAALDACRDPGNRWLFPELLAEELEPWGGVRRIAYANPPQATHAVDVTEHVAAAIASLECHAQYLQALGPDYPSPRDLLEQILGAGGRAAGLPYAVTFEVFEL
ncbi:MAG: PIG-L family deacetylase [Austwickia sp.]|nr:PIG-L family deacetylase [Actinomycetota bacterium]MCO5311119.1 PIG-L family deacetylase [Austwickia sp.]